MVAIPFLVNSELAFVTVATAVVLLSPFAVGYRLSYRLAEASTSTANQLMGWVKEIAIGWVTLAAANKVEVGLRRFGGFFSGHARFAIKAQLLQQATAVFLPPISIIAGLIAAYHGVNSGVPLGEIAFVLWSFLRAIPIGNTAYQSSLAVVKIFPSMEQVHQLTGKHPSVIDRKSRNALNTVESRSLTLANVAYAYPGLPAIFEDLNLTISVGKLTGLVGRSGAGKSTALQILIGFVAPLRGNVLLDGKEVENFSAVREVISFVPQEPFLFNATLRQNLTLFDDGISENSIWEACSLTLIDDFVRSLPRGLDTEIGDMGKSLSGGQRQRIILARALLRNPRYVLIDEGTTGFDQHLEVRVFENLRELCKTKGIGIAVVTHNVRIHKILDEIVRIDNDA